jgi:hypothetical protein
MKLVTVRHFIVTVKQFLFVLFLFACPVVVLHAQKMQAAAANTQNTRNDLLDPDRQTADALNRRVLNHHDTLTFFFAVLPDKPIRCEQNRMYYWFRRDTVLTTAGGYDGRVLDGEYKVLYPNKNLRENGNFNMGIKTGVWKTWYPDGALETITHWKNGEQFGAFELYDENGKALNPIGKKDPGAGRKDPAHQKDTLN